MPNSLHDQLQDALGAGFALGRELGGGGMSRVFLARDAALERDVVVKVLAPELAAGVSAERFAREIKLAAGLQQANIVPLLSAGETGGLPYYTMPFVDGLSLRARIDRNGALPLGEATSVLRDVARALAYAHARGVVHRDIKPDNILLSGDAAVVTDFGIAKALSASRTVAPGGTLTQVGTSIGTPAYMAPEQAAGDPATDHRADLYALGCVAYEMLAGHAPFAGRPAHQLFAAHLNELPAPVAAERADVPPALAALVMQCLAKSPDERPQGARAVLTALDEIGGASASGSHGARAGTFTGGSSMPRSPRTTVLMAAGAVVLLGIVAAGGWALFSRNGAAGAAAGDPAGGGAHTLVVLPFEYRGDSSDAYFAEGITDAVRTKLTALPGMSVIARASSMSYAGTETPLPEIARELGVHYLLTGTVRFAGTGGDRRVQVSPELVEINEGRSPESRWAESFDASVRDVFGVQSEVAGRVAAAMQVALGGGEQAQLAAAPTRNPAAYDAFLRGEAIRNSGANDPSSLRRARAAYGEAVRQDSSMAPAWAGLSYVASMLYFQSSPTEALAREARASADRAIALAPGSSDGYVALSAYHHLVGRDLAAALSAAMHARTLAPQDANVQVTVAILEASTGRLEPARATLAEIVRVDPRNIVAWRRYGVVLTQLGRIEEARVAANRYEALAPRTLAGMHAQVQAELGAGDLPAARRVVARAVREIGAERVVAFLATYFDLGWVLDADQARLLLTLGPESFDGDRGQMALIRAQQYGWLGEGDRARAWGDSAARHLATQLRDAPDDPQLHALRGLALAYAGRASEAQSEVARGLALQGPTPDQRMTMEYGYVLYVAARVALLSGDRERALDRLTESRRARFIASPAWIRAEPTWAPLRGHPRFIALVGEDPAAE